MRILTARTGLVIGLVCIAPTQGFAAASSYLCAISEVYECAAGDGCERADLKDINLSAFVTVDIDKKQLSSAGVGEALRTEDIEGVATTDKAVFLYGTQDEETWNATLSLENGALSGGITSGPSSFAIFGNCMPKP